MRFVWDSFFQAACFFATADFFPSIVQIQHTFDKRDIITDCRIIHHRALQIDVVAIKHRADDIWDILSSITDASDIDLFVGQIEKICKVPPKSKDYL